MSTDKGTDPGTVGSVDDLHRVLRSLQARIDDLEGELAAERERSEQLERRLEERERLVEFRGSEDNRQIEDIYIADLPVGQFLSSKASRMVVEDLQERVDEIYTGNQESADPERTLPIQQITRVYRSDPETLSNANERRAAIVWSHFFDVATQTPSKIVLSSSDVKTILVAEDEDTHTETIRRVMKQVADLGKDYVELQHRDGQNHLVIDRSAWEAFVRDLQKGQEGGR